MDSLVERKISPLYKEGYPFMWYLKLKDGSYIYEFDDRKVNHWTDNIRNKYINWLNTAKQEYYRRQIGLGKNLKRIVIELFDNIIMLFNPNSPNRVKETLFDNVYHQNKTNIDELGIVGNGGSVYIDLNRGQICINPEMQLSIYLIIDGIRVPITQQIDLHKKDTELIERHEVSYEFDLMAANQRPVSANGQILGWTIGYGGLLKFDARYGREDILKYKLLYTLPLDRPNFITVSLTSLHEITAELHLSYMGNNDKTDISLPPNQEMSYMIAF